VIHRTQLGQRAQSAVIRRHHPRRDMRMLVLQLIGVTALRPLPEPAQWTSGSLLVSLRLGCPARVLFPAASPWGNMRPCPVLCPQVSLRPARRKRSRLRLCDLRGVHFEGRVIAKRAQPPRAATRFDCTPRPPPAPEGSGAAESIRSKRSYGSVAAYGALPDEIRTNSPARPRRG